MRKAIILCFTSLAVLFSKTVFAQQQYFFSNYTVEDGLSNNVLRSIIKDSEGYLWVGTAGGLNRFNGYDFVTYKSLASDSTTLPSNSIGKLLSDYAGNLWIATEQGVCKYDKRRNNFKRIYCHTPNGEKIISVPFSDLLEDSKKNIWACTLGLGLLKYDTKEDCFETLEQFSAQAKSEVASMTEDTDGTLWIAGRSFLLHFNSSTGTCREYANRISGGDKFQGVGVFPDASDGNSLWITSWGYGLVHFNKQSGAFIPFTFERTAPRNISNIVFNIHQHSKNKLWLTTNRGVIIFDSEKKKFDSLVRDSISDKPVINSEAYCIYKDDENITWIGTSSGLCNIHPAKQGFVSEPLWLHAPIMKYFFDEAQGKVYAIRFYSNRCLIIHDRKEGTQKIYKIPNADELRAEPFGIVKDNNGLIWIGTTKGIYTFDEKEKKFALFEPGKQLHIPARTINVRNAFKDSAGNLWFACYGRGLLMIGAEDKTVKAFFHDDKDPNSFPFTGINAIAEGPGNMIYCCDEFHGIVRLNHEGKITRYFNSSEKKYAPLMLVNDMAVDENQRIWVATRNNGLVCIDRDSINTFARDDDGNLIDEQLSIAVDAQEKIWFTASNGVYRFDPSDKSFSHFTLQDGLPIRTPLFVPMNNGKFSYIFSQGIFCFDPLSVSKTTGPLHVHLTSFSVNGRISQLSNFIDQVDTIRLMNNENNLTLEFAANNFTSPGSTHYSYMLEGNDGNWSTPSRTRTVNFSQLIPGNYSLRLRTGENSPEKKIFIQIVPAWWQAHWFRWLSAFALIGILFFSIRYYLSFRYQQKIATLERQREIENIRMRISRDIHDEIGSGLTKIKLMSRNLSKVREETALKETSSKISVASDELIQNLGEIVWTVNPANDTLENVFAFVRNYVSKLFDENPDLKLNLNFTDPEKIPQGLNMNPEIKRNLLLILKEALTNIFKHSQATEVNLSLLADKSKIELQINDNGTGITNENQNGFGNGLKNIRKRAESISAELNIHTGAGNGTTIRVMVPLG